MSKKTVGKCLYDSSLVLPGVLIAILIVTTGQVLFSLLVGIATLVGCLFIGNWMVRSADKAASKKALKELDDRWGFNLPDDDSSSS